MQVSMPWLALLLAIQGRQRGPNREARHLQTPSYRHRQKLGSSQTVRFSEHVMLSRLQKAVEARKRADAMPPMRLPEGWTPDRVRVPVGFGIVEKYSDAVAMKSTDGLRVIVGAAVELDGKAWLHVSFSRKDKLPSWFDCKRVKSLFIGDDKTALQVFPSSDKYVDIHEHCLHLWHCMDGDVTPDFTHGIGTI